MDLGPLHLYRRAGPTVEHHGHRLTPEHLVARLDFPGIQGGFLLNRAIAVRVESPGQPVHTLPVLNYTRLGQILILGIGLFAAILVTNWRK